MPDRPVRSTAEQSHLAARLAGDRNADGPATLRAILQGLALVVDGDTLIAMAAEDVLRAQGWRDVHVATSVRAAPALLARNQADVAMLDIDLGGETCQPVAQALSERRTPSVFATGYNAELAPDLGFGPVPVVTKPYSAQDLVTAISRVMGQA